MRELQEDVGGPEASRPQAKGTELERDVLRARARPDEGDEGGERGEGELVGDDIVRQQVVKVLQGIVPEHGPALETLDGAQLARRRRVTLQSGHPLIDGEKT